MYNSSSSKCINSSETSGWKSSIMNTNSSKGSYNRNSSNKDNRCINISTNSSKKYIQKNKVNLNNNINKLSNKKL